MIRLLAARVMTLSLGDAGDDTTEGGDGDDTVDGGELATILFQVAKVMILLLVVRVMTRSQVMQATIPLKVATAMIRRWRYW